MKCPYCGFGQDRVVDSRESKEADSIRRRRECERCNRLLAIPGMLQVKGCAAFLARQSEQGKILCVVLNVQYRPPRMVDVVHNRQSCSSGANRPAIIPTERL